MADVFISHSTKDKETADKAVAYLEERGISCWIAPRDIIAGTDWAAAISTAITSVKIFLLIYSENSAASEQCAREMNLAETVEGLFVVPYKIDEAPLTGTYQYYLTGAHWIMADAKKKNYNFDGLYLMLSGILGKADPNAADNSFITDPDFSYDNAAVPEETAPAKKSVKKFIIAGTAGAAVLAGIIVGSVLLFSNTGKTEVPVQTTNTRSPAVSETQDSGSPSYGTITDYTLTYNNIVIEGTYIGELNANGQPHGKGEFNGIYTVINVACNTTVKGEFADGMLNGSATMTLVSEGGSKEVHESDSFVNGKVNGIERTTNTMEDGTQSVGEVEMVGGLANGHGKGKATYPNGDTEEFDGTYVDGAMNGEGRHVYNFAEGSSKNGYKSRTYIGEYKDNLQSGTGRYTLEYYDGTKEMYVGEFANDVYNGNGTLIFTYPDSTNGSDIKSSELSGEYKNGYMNGKGKRTDEYMNGEKRVYEGSFADGKFDGEGTRTIYFAEDNEKKINTYVGGFKEGCYDGKGKDVTEYRNGDVEIIEGDWIKGTTSGSVYYECDYAEPQGGADLVRESYSGNVKDNIRCGIAIQKLYLEDGTVISINGEWAEGAPIDGCTVTEQDQDGNLKKSGIWKNGTIEWLQVG